MDDESKMIREEVLVLLAHSQDGGQRLELADVGTDGLKEGVVLEQPKYLGGTPKDILTPEQEEYRCLNALLVKVRTCSESGELFSTLEWADAGVVPTLVAEPLWEQKVCEYISDGQSGHTGCLPATAKQSQSDMVSCTCDESYDDADECARGCAIAGACNDIVVLHGEHAMYLYSSDYMTEAYARWAFLAREDNRIQTFVECVRDESRLYPRPMEAASFVNQPFALSLKDVEAIWEVVHDGGAHPDIDILRASNGDVYYYSKTYLSPTYAASLAEWNSVERQMYL